MEKNKRTKTTDERQSTLQIKHNKLEAKRDKLQKQTIQVANEVQQMERTLHDLQQSRLMRWLSLRNLKQSLRHAAAYVLGRRNRKRLYSKTYKRKQATNDIMPYIRLLYEEGFTEAALHDLQSMYKSTTNQYVKRALAQELALYFANRETRRAAEMSLYYIQRAKKREHNETIRRQLAIIEAECYVRLGDNSTAQQRLHERLQRAPHRDLYLALANTTETIEERLFWLNKTLSQQKRQPIIFETTHATTQPLTYATLHETTVAGTEVSGPKISVILPAYNAADSIHIAIESMLKQTWTNIELLIVDDCSTDGTYEVMKQYAAQDERIILLQTKRNSGPYVARNIALHAATGEFVTVNDADDWSHHEKLAVQAEHLCANKDIVANTSELARLTETFTFHRRGTRGKYIFSNMSSLLFRRKQVLEQIGYWDEVRFAADGEFKRRLIQTFGQEAVVDLQTGPLSLPEQSSLSLTGSSAFGYAGFFMGARKEYVDSFSSYHKEAPNLYYSYEPNERLFPVPEPMLPTSNRTERHVDIVIVANFYTMNNDRVERMIRQIEVNTERKLTTGLMQLYDYDTVSRTRTFNEKIRQLIDGTNVQMLVYGEQITTDVLFIHSMESLQEKQRYIAQIRNRITVILIDDLLKVTYNRERKVNGQLRQTIRRSAEYFSNEIRLYPLNESVRNELETTYKRELGNHQLAEENWLVDHESDKALYESRLDDWLVEEHEYKLT